MQVGKSVFLMRKNNQFVEYWLAIWYECHVGYNLLSQDLKYSLDDKESARQAELVKLDDYEKQLHTLSKWDYYFFHPWDEGNYIY